MRAVERLVRRVANAVASGLAPAAPRTGLVWHTQGSGKTLSMIVAANKLLRRLPALKNPTHDLLPVAEDLGDNASEARHEHHLHGSEKA